MLHLINLIISTEKDVDNDDTSEELQKDESLKDKQDN